MSISFVPVAYALRFSMASPASAGRIVQRAGRVFCFGPFSLQPERQMLMKDGSPVRIGGRALDILTMLVERNGEVVGKRELMARVWPDTFVEESNLKVNMVGLRRALGEDLAAPQYIATVVGRGYRFVADVWPSRTRMAAQPGPGGALRLGNGRPESTAP